eukprot:TRINITY_DN20419_c0_g4_i1.p1 TRINITY_DN20419_c0_g4~~TRINITY_DN20419_c0_g4_i1.p1  ORF type:complete len:407 (-),score=38.76 TRINITY_DN20419_c0_g4_i1:60-1280(-)
MEKKALLKYHVMPNTRYTFGYRLQMALSLRKEEFELITDERIAEMLYDRGELAWSNKNSLSVIQNYLDGADFVYRHKLAELFPDATFLPLTKFVSTTQPFQVQSDCATTEPPFLWFLKPCADLVGCGQGILVGKDPVALVKQMQANPPPKINSYLLQAHVPHPVLYKFEEDGPPFKFDIRLHGAVIYRTDPEERKQNPPGPESTRSEVRVFLHRHGYLRLAVKPWDPNEPTMYSQLTNYSIAKKHSSFDEDKCAVYFDEQMPYYTAVMEQTQSILCELLTKAQLDTTGKDGALMLGIDIMVSQKPGNDEYKVYLLEVNQRVGLDFTTKETPVGKPCWEVLETYADLVIHPLTMGRLPTVAEAAALGWNFVWQGPPCKTCWNDSWKGYSGPAVLSYQQSSQPKRPRR